MKFWQKIYLLSILVFVIIFNIASFLVIERSHNKILQQAIDVSLSQSISIHSSVDASLPILSIYDSIDYEKTILTSIANEFVGRNSEQEVYIEIMDDSKRTVFNNSNFQMPLERHELEQLGDDSIHYILREIDGRTILFASNITEIKEKKYMFTYMKDVTGVFQDRIDQYNFFAKVDFMTCIVFMLIMFFISRGLTRSIDHLNRSAKVIAQGGFSERAVLTSKDEIGVLAQNFNEMAEVVEEKISELERNNEEKQRFIDNFTHELKTPLTSIIGYANFLRTTKYNEELFVDGLNVIYSEGKRLESLSQKLKELILLKKDQLKLELLDFRELVMEIKSELELIAKDKNVKIVLNCNRGELLVERDLIKILIFNLVDNALKASLPNQTITLQTYWQEERYHLVVIDQGIGIREEDKDKIFEPFFMVDKARTRDRNGSGLGLAICKNVAEIHGALIRVKSIVEQGTSVEVIFESNIDVERELNL